MTILTIDDILRIPDENFDYGALDTQRLVGLALQRYEPWLATSALGELAQRGAPETADAATTILRAEPWDVRLTAYALTILFNRDPELAIREMTRIITTQDAPAILAAMIENVLSARERFDTGTGRDFAIKLAERLLRVPPDESIEDGNEFLAIYGPGAGNA